MSPQSNVHHESQEKAPGPWTGHQIGQPLEGHTSVVNSASFSPDSPDGKRIVSASDDFTVRVWEFPPIEQLVDDTRKRFKDRPLTKEERQKYYLE